MIAKGRTSMVALPDFTPLQGGQPIVVDGQVVGAVGVSGAASAQQDDQIATAAAAAVSSADIAATASHTESATARGAVTHFGSDTVAAAFEKGAVLFDAPGSRFAIHASRRLEPGQAEIHAKETDVIYVLHGGAKFVTGGSVVDPKPTTADEVRGSAIRDGQTRQLRPGDVVVVPAGVPHWFKHVDSPFHCYVVKVR